MDQLENKIIEFISHKLGIDKKDITLQSSFFEDFNLDRLTLGELYLQLENEFGIKLPLEQINNVQTVGDIIKIVELNLNEII